MTDSAEIPGKRRPNDDDLAPILELLWDGQSLRSACGTLGLHTPSVSTWIHADDGRREQYMRACEGRADYLQEDGLTVTRASALGGSVDNKKVDSSGARAYLDAIKWATARMAPKTVPVQRIDLTSRTRQMTDDEIAAEIAALEAGKAGDA